MRRINVDEQEKIETLFGICKERSVAYETAAENVFNQDLRVVLSKYAEQSRSLMNDYLVLNKRLADKNAVSTSEIGGFKNNNEIETNIKEGDPRKVLEACKAGDLVVLKTLDDHLNEEISAELADLLSRHILEINAAYDNICGILKYHFNEE
jgi:hypothetical protein